MAERSRAVLVAMFLAGPAFVGGAAHADSPASAATDEVRIRYQLGNQLFQEGKYRDAIDQFKAAEALHPDPALDYDIATCYRRLGDLASARHYLEWTVNETAADSPYRQRALLDLGQVDAVLAKQSPASTMEKASPAGSRPATGAPSSTPSRALGTATATSRSTEVPLPPQRAAGSPGAMTPVIWASAGISGALLAGSAVFAALGAHSDAALHSYPTSVPQADSELSSARRDAYVADGLLAAGLAATAVTGWLLYRRLIGRERTADLAAFIAPGSAGPSFIATWSAPWGTR